MSKLKLTTMALVFAQVFVGSAANAAVDQSAANIDIGPTSISAGQVVIPDPQGGSEGGTGS